VKEDQMKKKYLLIIVGIFTLASLLVLVAGGEKPPKEGEMPYEGRTLRVHWAVFAPSDALQDLSNKMFTPETGIKVIVEQTPWSDFVQKYNAELIAGGDAWDIICGDSQDVGNGAERGHYLELTEFFDENDVRDKFTPETLTAFGEWPKGSGRMYGVPALTDPTFFVYRKDLFGDPTHKANFKKKYGYDLVVPETWDQLIDAAEYFYEDVDGMYGIALYGDNGYDSLNMFGETIMWCFGGDLGDFNTMQVKGIVNSPDSIAGIEAYRKLFSMGPPGMGTAFFEEVNNAYISGIVPMIFNYTATLPVMENRETNPFYEDTGYFVTPRQKAQYTSLGGQAMNVITYAKKNHDIVMEYLKWWISDEAQLAYASYPGCFNGSYAIMNSDEYVAASDLNKISAESVPYLKDWWAVPEYAQTIRTYAETVGRYVVGGEGTAKQALDSVAEQWHEVFEKAGYYD
jgi:multiple sugar transport system substrate-binding protein